MLETVSNVVQKATGMGQNKKIEDIQKNIVDSDGLTQRTDYGVGIANPNDTLAIASKEQQGPHLLEDHIARERINHFDHERIPERVVHARGNGAFGTFTVMESAEDVTYAKVLTDTSRKTPVFVRFSTVLGSRGAAESVREVRGFAVKFYTEEGNWDIVGNNIPVFFIQDAVKFPDLIHAAKPEPNSEVPQAQTAHNNFWDFSFLHSEATHMLMWAMSDRTIPRSYRMVQGFGVNTFCLINKEGKRHFVKFHWTPELGVNSLVWDEALKIAGQDPDFLRKDLWEAIENGIYPKWKFGIQLIPEEKEHDFEFDILDATKVWPEDLVPIRWIGQLELNRNPDEYFSEVEQVAFCTGHIVPGIDFSNDPLLHGRNFSYLDTQMSRLGVNFQQLPINRPICPVFNHHSRDGQSSHRINKSNINYWPNRFETTPPTSVEKGGFDTYPEKIAGFKARLKAEKFKEHYNQAQMFYNSLSPHEQAHVQLALGFELDHCDDETVYSRISQRLADVDLKLAQGVAEMVGSKPPEKAGRPNKGQKAPNLTQVAFAPQAPTIATRRVAILVADGFNHAEVAAAITALKAANAFPYVIAPRRSTIKAKGGETIMAAHHLEGWRSTLVDTILVPGGDHVLTLRKNGRAVHWVREAFAHCKALGAVGEGVGLIQDALGPLVEQVEIASKDAGRVTESYGVVTGGSIPEESSAKQGVSIAKEAKDFLGQYFFAISQHRCYERELDGLTAQLAY